MKGIRAATISSLRGSGRGALAIATLLVAGAALGDRSGLDLPVWLIWFWPEVVKSLEAALCISLFLVCLGLPSDRCTTSQALLAAAFATAGLFLATDAFLGFQPWPVTFPPVLMNFFNGAHKRFTDIAELVIGAGLLAALWLPARSRPLGARGRILLAAFTHGTAVAFLMASAYADLTAWGLDPGAEGAKHVGSALDLGALTLLVTTAWRIRRGASEEESSMIRLRWSSTAIVFLAAGQVAGLLGWVGAELLVAVKHTCSLAGVYALYRAYFVAQVVHPYREILATREVISWKLIMAAELRDNETGAHIRRIGRLAEMLGKALGHDPAVTEMLRHAAPMHDIGKVGIPDEVLRKPGALTAEEWTVMKTHAAEGERILRGSDVVMLEMAADIAGAHHERWDGTGYPRGISGEEIPECARITAMVDVYDALSHRRAYKPALDEAEVLRILQEGRGSHFEPRIFDAFLAHLTTAKRILAEDPDYAAIAVDGKATSASALPYPGNAPHREGLARPAVDQSVPTRSSAMAPAVRWALVLALISVASMAVLRGPEASAPALLRKATGTFACPMHPAAASDHPGECPFCGMTLVPGVQGTLPISDAASQPPTKR